MKTRLLPLGIPLVMFAAAACSEGTTGTVSLALTTARPLGASLAAAPVGSSAAPQVTTAGDSTVIVLGNDTIIVRSVELVLREIELERVETAQCDDIMDNDDCEEFETGPVLVGLPLGATATVTEVSVNAPAGMYNELEFEIHKPDDSTDAAFIAAHPAFADVSIRVTGTFSNAGTRTDFTYITDLNEQQEIALDPPLTVAEGSATNVTLRLDIARWFVSGTALVDPATANKGGPNENLVRDNIRVSIDAFRDDDHDGHDDDHDGPGS
jgi:hypothetical protein